MCETMTPILVSGPKIPLEPKAIDQLERTARLGGCRHAVGMPDLHAGPGIPIGACFAFEHVRPALVGSDAGCGVRVVVVKSKKRGDVLERRVREAFAQPLGILQDDGLVVAQKAWRSGPRGLASLTSLPESLRAWAAAQPTMDELPASGPLPDTLSGLGTIGGGNHFAEISRVMSIEDAALAQSLGIDKDSTVVVVHSGSRGVGAQIQRQWGDVKIEGSDAASYLSDLAGAVRFAVTNRLLLAWQLLEALGSARMSKIQGEFDVVHNTVVPFQFKGQSVWLHRKGAAPSMADAPTIVLGSRGTPSFILRGKGDEATLASVAHGAGRRLTRSDAFQRFKQPHAKKALGRTPLGGRVICEESKLLFEEHPEAYKPIEPVIDALEQRSMATRAVALAPIITVKQ